MSSLVTDRIALITGGSRGLGASIAVELAKRGVDIVITFVANEAAANDVVKQVQALGRKAAALKLDVAAVATFDAFVAQLQTTLKTTIGRDTLDFVVQNGGLGSHSALAKTTEAEFDLMINVHFKGPFFLTQKLLPLIRDGTGAVLNISTGLTRFSMQGYGAYASAKSALETYSNYLAQELGPRKIRVNVLAPGAILTDFGGGAVRANEQIKNFIAGQTPLGRVGEADDIGRAATSILLDLNWVNAQRIEASGGIHP